MIKFTKSYETDDGQLFGSIEEAQIHEIENIFIKDLSLKDPFSTAKEAAYVIVKHKTVVIDALTTTPNSKPKARKINGGTKTRTSKKTIITDAATNQTNLPFDDSDNT